MSDKAPPIDSSLVKEMVAVAHGDLARVMELLEQERKLVNAAWDWGGGPCHCRDAVGAWGAPRPLCSSQAG